VKLAFLIDMYTDSGLKGGIGYLMYKKGEKNFCFILSSYMKCVIVHIIYNTFYILHFSALR